MYIYIYVYVYINAYICIYTVRTQISLGGYVEKLDTHNDCDRDHLQNELFFKLNITFIFVMVTVVKCL